MPALTVFRRKTILGGDDLQPAALLAILVRLLQLGLFILPLYVQIIRESHDRQNSIEKFIFFDPSNDGVCRHSHYFGLLFVIYTVASTFYNVISGFVEYKIAYWSSQGSPTQVEPRSSHVRSLLEFKLFPSSILLFLVFLTGIFATGFAKRYYYCKDLDNDTNGADQSSSYNLHYWHVALAFTLITQLSEVLVSWIYMCHLWGLPIEIGELGDSQDGWDSSVLTNQNHELAEQMWAERCATMCRCLSMSSCFMFGGKEILGNAEFGEIARAIADYLEARGVLDVVPSDIVTGFIVLQRVQRGKIREARKRVIQDAAALSSMARGVPSSLTEQVEVLLPSTDFVPTSSYTLDSTAQNVVYHMNPNGHLVGRIRSILSKDSVEDMQFLREGARYSKYALAIYTWVLYLYVHPCTGLPRLLTRTKCQCCRRRRLNIRLSGGMSRHRQSYDGRIRGDNMCEIHKAALLLHAGLDEADIVYAQLESGFEQVPYAILLDHEWKSVVVTVRGTFSLEDCVTDVLIQPESLETLGEEFGFDGKDQYCHGGVLACTQNVYRDLSRHKILEQLLLGESAIYPGYRLLLVGHSLGAGTCTILSFMLRAKFPSLRCINYCPPGCTLTEKMANECKLWCSTFVLDSDLVPRLSVDSMEHLRDEVLEIIGRIKVSKADVARRIGQSIFTSSVNWNYDSSDCPPIFDVGEILYEDDEIPDSEYQAQLGRFKLIQAERRQSRGLARNTKLYPPGRMVHLLKTGEKSSCVQHIAKCLTCCTTNAGFEYTPMWIENDDLNEIVVSATMATDHFPNRITSILQDLAGD